MPKIGTRPLIVAILLAAIAITGCASQSTTYDEDGYAEVRCPRDYKMKCIKRSAAPEECTCVPQGDVEEMVEVLINPGIH